MTRIAFPSLTQMVMSQLYCRNFDLIWDEMVNGSYHFFKSPFSFRTRGLSKWCMVLKYATVYYVRNPSPPHPPTFHKFQSLPCLFFSRKEFCSLRQISTISLDFKSSKMQLKPRENVPIFSMYHKKLKLCVARKINPELAIIIFERYHLSISCALLETIYEIYLFGHT